MHFDITDDLAYEIYALIILQSPFPHGNQIVKQTIDGKFLDFKYFKKSESPDWQSEELDLGIEVTIAMDEKEIVDSKTFSTATKGATNLDEVKGRLQGLDKKGIFNAEVTQQGPFYIMGHDQPDNIEAFKRCIAKKITLSAKYSKFRDNWLFIYFVGYLDKAKIAEAIRSIRGYKSFNRYIINPLGNSDGIYYVDEPYQTVDVVRHANMSSEMIMDEVEKIRTKL